MEIEILKIWKTMLGMTAEDIAVSSGVPLSTVQKIFSGVTKNPRRGTMDAIVAVLLKEANKKDVDLYLEGDIAHLSDRVPNAGKKKEDDINPRQKTGGLPGQHAYCYSANPGNANGMVRESAATYAVRQVDEGSDSVGGANIKTHSSDPQVYDPENRSGTYTLEDYYALPDELRVELIDGVFYTMPAPALIHQLISLELAILFRECVDAHGSSCTVYLAPCDVRLDKNNSTMVQPDIFIVCEEYDIDAKRIEGAPALTVEILSPSTRSKDMMLKLYKYWNAGVREYWIVDPERRTILVYDLEHEDYYPKQYVFDDEIPIGISGGKCSIDFSRVLRRIERKRG